MPMKMRVRKNISNDDPTTSFSATKIADARRVIGYSGRNCGIARGAMPANISAFAESFLEFETLERTQYLRFRINLLPNFPIYGIRRDYHF